MAHVGLAEVLYERDELAAAHEHATQGIALCRQLADSLILAAPDGYVRVFADEGAPMTRLLGRLAGSFAPQRPAEEVTNSEAHPYPAAEGPAQASLA